MPHASSPRPSRTKIRTAWTSWWWTLTWRYSPGWHEKQMSCQVHWHNALGMVWLWKNKTNKKKKRPSALWALLMNLWVKLSSKLLLLLCTCPHITSPLWDLMHYNSYKSLTFFLAWLSVEMWFCKTHQNAATTCFVFFLTSVIGTHFVSVQRNKCRYKDVYNVDRRVYKWFNLLYNPSCINGRCIIFILNEYYIKTDSTRHHQ